MKEFDLSDKEIKALLQAEGLEEPSMAFNANILSKIKELDAVKAKPVSAPKWLILTLLSILIIPSIVAISNIKFNQTNFFSKLDFSRFNLDIELNGSYLWISLSVVIMLWVAVLFDKFVLKKTHHPG